MKSKQGTEDTLKDVLPRTKKCWKCGKTKPVSMFHRDSSQRGGYHGRCKECKVYKQSVSSNRHGADDGYYLRQLRIQNGTCAICQRPERSVRRKRLAIDHNHITGQLRGLLCMGCNTSLGKLGDSIESIERVLKYLKGELEYD